jgi:hypothetical protein
MNEESFVLDLYLHQLCPFIYLTYEHTVVLGMFITVELLYISENKYFFFASIVEEYVLILFLFLMHVSCFYIM